MMLLKTSICLVLCCVLNALTTDAQASCACSFCKNGAQITLDSNNNFVCSCPLGFTGKFCDQAQCLNGGTPLNVNGALQCSCAAGFFGVYCATSCPANFITLTSGDATTNNKVGCFNFVMAQRKWADSQTYCQSLDPRATLAVIDNKNKNDAMKQYLSGLAASVRAPCSNANFGSNWVTALQRVVPGDCTQKTFVWRPIGLPQTSLVFSDFAANQPDCTNGGGGYQAESCAGLWDTTQYQWNDIPCDGTVCAVCEVPAQ